MFENLKKALAEELETRKANTRFYIVEGYYPDWAPQHCNNLDAGLKRWSTPAKWEAYQAGKLDRSDACVKATARAFRDLEKTYAKKLELLTEVEAAPELQYGYVNEVWNRSRTWGWNPRAEVATEEADTFVGTASGCGYDKASAAIAEALNKSRSMLKVLYVAAEKALAEGKTFTRANSATVSWRDILGYGSGYSALPYFEGGCGVSCFETIFKNCGYRFAQVASGKRFDAYSIHKI